MINVVSGKTSFNNSLEIDSNTFFIENLGENGLEEFIDYIQELVLTEPVTILDATDEIKIDEEEILYFKYNVKNLKSAKLEVTLQNNQGETQMSLSFENRNPDFENPDDEEDASLQNILNLKTTVKESVDIPLQLSSTLYIAVKGIQNSNIFKIQVTEIKQTSSAVSNFKLSNTFFNSILILIVFIISFN